MRRAVLPLALAAVLLAALAAGGSRPRLAAADELKPNDNLVTDGVPPIPLDLARDVQRYTDSRSATLLD